MKEFSLKVSKYEQNHHSPNLSANYHGAISLSASFQHEKWLITRTFALAAKIMLDVIVLLQ